MNLELIKTLTIDLLKKYNLELYSLKVKKEFGMQILEVLVNGLEIDANELGKVNEALNDAIDEHLPNDYYLEVSTPGAIRVLNSLSEVKRQVGKYLKLTKDGNSVKGILEKVEDDTLYIKVNDKGRIKVIKASYKEQDEVKLTVKF